MSARKQVPSKEGNFLYREMQDGYKWFSTLVYLGCNDTEWDECTGEEKQEWEKEQEERRKKEEEMLNGEGNKEGE